ncbi:MAG: DNA-directed RNA polymerase subunit alpha C-terminal domain-containing protein [Tissierellia bacterium]|nr:DNA-directed RNA polymerase subunit alpha C-terminal domain-containing protein [Tissierellia bacterium]
MNKEQSINELNLSARTRNALTKYGILTVGQFFALSRKEVYEIPGLGMKSRQEIERVKNNSLSIFFEDAFEVETQRSFVYQGEEYVDLPIEELGFSNRVYNCLSRSNISFLSEVLALSDEDFLGMKSFGRRSQQEMQRFKENLNLVRYPRSNVEKESFLIENRKQIIQLGQALEMSNADISIVLLKMRECTFTSSAEISERMDYFFHLEIVQKAYEKQIIKSIEHTAFGINLEEILMSFPEQLRQEKYFEVRLNHLLEEDAIDFIFDDRLMVNRDSFSVAGGGILQARMFDVLDKRFQGMTLEEIGAEYDVSRERIRQIERKAL